MRRVSSRRDGEEARRDDKQSDVGRVDPLYSPDALKADDGLSPANLITDYQAIAGDCGQRILMDYSFAHQYIRNDIIHSWM